MCLLCDNAEARRQSFAGGEHVTCGRCGPYNMSEDFVTDVLPHRSPLEKERLAAGVRALNARPIAKGGTRPTIVITPANWREFAGG